MQKTVLITGATDGIGKVTALALAKKQYHVIIHGRKADKAAMVQAEIIKLSGNPNIEIEIADLFDLNAVRNMANRLLTRLDHLDVLINNAGGYLGKERRINTEGLEHTLTLNVLAPFLLTQLLLPLIAKSLAGRIVNTSSGMHRRAPEPNFDDFQFKKHFEASSAYASTKLYVIWLTRHWVKELQSRGIKNVTVNASHPGAVATNFGKDDDKGFLPNLIFWIAPIFESTPEKGAQTTIFLADSASVTTTTGQFFNNKKKLEKPEDKYYTIAREQELWDRCLTLVKPYMNAHG